MSSKKTILATVLFFGMSAGLLAMIPTSSHTNAAIAVIDQRNIEEAIKTAIETAKILTEKQKQLALKILAMKKFDISMIQRAKAKPKSKVL